MAIIISVLTAVFFIIVPTLSAKTITIKLAHPDPKAEIRLDKNDPGAFGGCDNAANVFKRLVELKSKGQISVNIYPNGQLGAEAEEFQSVSENIIQMTMASGAVIGSFVPEYMAFTIPYLFESFEIMELVLEGPIGKELNSLMISKTGVRVLAWGYFGQRHFTNNVRPLKSADDFKGLKLRVPETPDMIKMVESLSAQPVPINYGELYTSLQQGVVDGQENPFSVIEAAKLYEVQKYLTIDGHRIATIPFSINENFFQSLSPEHKRIVIDAARHAASVYKGTVHLGDTLWAEFLSKKGMQIYSPTDEEMKQFKEITQKAVFPYVRSQVGDEWFEKVVEASKLATKAYYQE